MYDLLIKGGTIVDGTGKPRFVGDVAVSKGKIAAIGDLAKNKVKAKKTINAAGKIVCPGVIDVHSHADMTLVRDNHPELLAPLIKQGITTFVGGNCGMGYAPLGKKHAKASQDYIEAFTAKDFDKNINWNTIPEWYDEIEKRGVVMNFANLAPHGLMRIEACGLETRLATPAELKIMEHTLEEALEAGAIGLSTGLQYFPGSQSDTPELIQLAKIVHKHGGVFTSHLRSYGFGTFWEAINEVIEVAEKADVPAQISHLFAVPDFGIFAKPVRKIVKFAAWFSNNYWVPPVPLDLDQAKLGRLLHDKRSYGVKIGIDLLPDTTGFTHMLAFFPPWVLVGDRSQILKRLQSPVDRKKMDHDIETGKPTWPHRDGATWSMNFFKMMGWENVNIMSVINEKFKQFEGHNVAEIAKSLKKKPIDVCCDMLLENDGKVLVFESMAPPGDKFTERSMIYNLKDENTSICTDTILLGVGRPSHLFHSTFPLYFGKYVRNMKLLGLEGAVRKCTSLPANQIGIKDRGRLETGLAADILIFDFDKIGTKANFKNPQVDPEGIEYVFINGHEIVGGGKYNGGHHGKFLRHGKA